MAYNESMPLSDDKSKELLTDLGLTFGGGVGAAGGLASNDWLSKNIKGLDDWESLTKSVWNTNPFTSAHTGKALQVSPEVADKVLDTYVTGAQRLASQKVGPWRVGNIIGNVGLLPDNIKSLFTGKVDPAVQSMSDSYALFSDPASTKEALKTRMLDRARHSSYLDDTRGHEMRAAFDALSDDAKDILEKHPTSIKDKYDALAKLKNKAGLDYMENFILGHGKSHPGAVKLVGGGVIGDVKGGKLVDEVLHPGFAKNYIHKFRKPLQMAKALSKFGIGGAAAAAGLGLAGLGKTLGESISKSASVVSEDSPEALAKLLGGGGLLTLSGTNTLDSIKELIENRKKAPNMNIGFSYGDLMYTGDGHKAPSVHIRNILENYINSLPEGHELKGTTVLDEFGKPIANEYGGFKRKGGVQFHDIGNKVHGIAPGIAKDFNIVYNTGLGLAIPHPNPFVPLGNKKYGWNAADKLRGTTQSIRNYITDTPHTVLGVPFAGSTVTPAIPRITLPGMDRPLWNGNGYGYIGVDSKTLGYGPLPKSLQVLHATPFVAGSLQNLAPDMIGTPFIKPSVLDNLNKYTTKDQKLARLQEIINTTEFDDPEVKSKLQKIHDAIKKGKRVVTVAGSGTGAYVGSRTAHLLDSFDRLGVSNVEVVPLAANYTNAALTDDERKKLINNLELMDKNKRVTAFGRLKNEPYTLLQQLADINMASTGQMAISESANSGNLQYIPDDWKDVKYNKPLNDFRSSLWADALGAKPGAERDRLNKLFELSTPWLQVVNKGSMEAMPRHMGDVFKQFGHYEGPVREGVLNYLRAYGASEDTLRKPIIQQFDTDGIAELLLDKNKDLLADLSRRASEAAAANRAKIPEAHKALIDDMAETVKRNVRRQKLKGLPGALGGALGSGLGLYGMYSGIKQMMSPKNFSLNLS